MAESDGIPHPYPSFKEFAKLQADHTALDRLVSTLAKDYARLDNKLKQMTCEHEPFFKCNLQKQEGVFCRKCGLDLG